MKITDKLNMPDVMDFILHKLALYDTSRVESIRLFPLRGKRTVISGRCVPPGVFPRHYKKPVLGYRLSAGINILPEMFPSVGFTWAWVQSDTGWEVGTVLKKYETKEESAVFTLAHEAAHFLMHSSQIELENNEANANWIAHKWTNEFYGSGRSTTGCTTRPPVEPVST